MLLNLVRTEAGLVPVDDKSVEAVKKIRIGDDVFAEYKPRRNYRFHKKLYSMMNLILNNQEEKKSVNEILINCKMDAGYYDIYFYKGVELKIPKSIDFATMDNAEFSEFYSSAIDTCLELVPMGREELEDAILRYA